MLAPRARWVRTRTPSLEHRSRLCLHRSRRSVACWVEGGVIVKSLRTSRCAAALFVIAAVAVGIAGSGGTGRAAPGITFNFEPLIGTSSINEIPKVTYGKGIGFHLVIQNNGTNSTPQTSSVVVTSTSATYD